MRLATVVCRFARPSSHGMESSIIVRTPLRPRRRASRRALVVAVTAALVVAASTAPLYAATTPLAADDIPTVIDNIQNWLIGILAGLATLFLVLGGVRYVISGGDPGEVQKAKTALKSAAIGYCLAILAPVIIAILQSIVGG